MWTWLDSLRNRLALHILLWSAKHNRDRVGFYNLDYKIHNGSKTVDLTWTNRRGNDCELTLEGEDPVSLGVGIADLLEMEALA